MLATDLLCEFGTLFDPATEEPTTFLESVQSMSKKGDGLGFPHLPPVLMDSCERLSMQQLWGSKSSNVYSTSYTPGPVQTVYDDVMLGGALLEFSTTICPVLLFANHESKKVRACVYDAPISCMESELYKFRNNASEIEINWKGKALANSQLSMLELIGEHIKQIGLCAVPAHLLRKEPEAYHLNRTGPSPFLRMRTVQDEDEFQILESAILAHLCEKKMSSGVRCTNKIINNIDDFHDTHVYEFETFFSKSTLQLPSHPTDQAQTQWPPEELCAHATKMAKAPALCVSLCVMMHCKNDSATNAKLQSMIEKIHMGRTSSKQGHCLPLNKSSCSSKTALADLLACSHRVFSVTTLGQCGGISQACMVASSMIEPSEVGLVIGMLPKDVPPTDENIAAQSMKLIKNIAKTIDQRFAVLSIELNVHRNVKSIALLNSQDSYELDIDNAGRLLDCPWIFPIGTILASKEKASFFTLQSPGIQRDALRVCESVKLEHDKSGKDSKSIVQVSQEVDFTPLDKRLDSFKSMIEDLQNGLSSSKTPMDLNRLKDAKQKWSESREGDGANKKAKIAS